MTKLIRAARLVRVSSGKQAKKDRTSLPNQIKTLTEICTKNNWLSLEEDLFVEVISGAKGRENREVLDDLLEKIKRGVYQRLCVLDFDRSTRKGLGEWEEIKGILLASGCLMVINGVEYDMEDDNDELLTDINAVFAKRERQQTRKRIIRGLEATAAEGKNTGGRLPFGYTGYYPETRDGSKPRIVIEIDEDQAAAVRKAFELYATGVKSYFDIADELNAMGHRWKDGRIFNWQSSYYILRNPSYAGLAVRRRDYTRRHHATKLPQVTAVSKAYPPIISMELWERCQALREGKPKYKQLSNPRRHPLSGVLRCRSCGGSMVYRRDILRKADGTRKEVFSYACFNHLKRVIPCEAPQAIRYEVAHLAVIAAIKTLSKGIPVAAAPEAGPDEGAELAVKAKLLQLDNEEMELLTRLNKPLEHGGIREDQFRRYNQVLLARRDELDKELQALKRKAVPRHFTMPDVDDLAESLTVDDPMCNDVFRSLFAEIVLEPTDEKIQNRAWTSRKSLKLYRASSAVLTSGLALNF